MPVPPRNGILHVVDAAGYSLAGFRRLVAETAARQELAGGAIGAAFMLWAGATALQMLGFVALLLLLIAVEALNTAIEVLTDRISPEWSADAKQAKDLGSLAVGLMVLCNVGFLAVFAAHQFALLPN